MNNSLAVPNQGPWPVGQFAPDAQLGPGQRTYSATNILDFPTLMRIIHHWRWLVLGAVALGLAGSILATLLTKPVYRAWVTLEANPPTVSISDEQAREHEATTMNSYDFVATQVGLLKSKSVVATYRSGAQSGEQRGSGATGRGRLEAPSDRDRHRQGRSQGHRPRRGSIDQLQLRFRPRPRWPQ